MGESLSRRLFKARLEVIGELDHRSPDRVEERVIKDTAAPYGAPKTNDEVRRSLAERLQRETAAMNLDNFVVRPHRRLVEKYTRPEAWTHLSP